MDTILISKQNFLKELEDNPFIRNIVDQDMFITWNQPHPQFYYIEDKRIETFVTSKRISQIYKQKYGEKLSAKSINDLMLDLGFQPSKMGKTKVFMDCICRVD